MGRPRADASGIEAQLSISLKMLRTLPHTFLAILSVPQGQHASEIWVPWIMNSTNIPNSARTSKLVLLLVHNVRALHQTLSHKVTLPHFKMSANLNCWRASDGGVAADQHDASSLICS